jgi:hypothetical protein
MSNNDAIWTLVTEGIYLRDEGIRTEAVDAWRVQCLDWQDRMVAAVAGVWPNLARGFAHPMGEIDKTDPNEIVSAGERAHQRDVDAMSTIIRLVRARLMQD